MPSSISLYPKPISLSTSNGEVNLSSSSKMTQAIWDPKRNAVAIGVVGTDSSTKSSQKKQVGSIKSVPDQSLYLANHLSFNPTRRSLFTRSYEIFSSLQKVVQVCEDEEGMNHDQAGSALPSSLRLKYYHRIGIQYVIALKDYLSELEKDEDKNGEEIDLVLQMIEVFSLFVLVHIPSDGRGDGIVAEQILDWVNRTNPQPPKEEGEELSSLKVPYQHINFWPYIHACVIHGLLSQSTALLKSYTKTHNPTLNQLMIVTISLIKSAPRSTNFQQEIEFSQAVESFRESVDRLLLTLDSEMNVICEVEVQKASSGDAFEEDDLLHFQASFKILLEILRGDEERISEACYDWREALGAHLLWADPLCKRDDLPYLMKKVTKDWPIDETSNVDKISSAILSGEMNQLVQSASNMDKWLICHLIDLIDKLGYKLPNEPRTYFIKEFVEYLSVDQGLWRLMISYLDTVEDSLEWIKNILRRLVVEDEIAVKSDSVKVDSNSMEVDGEENNNHSDEVGEGLKTTMTNKSSKVTTKVSMLEMKMIYEEHGLEDELNRNARIISRRLMKQRKHGAAIAYAVTAGDSKLISRISDSLLDEYLTNGPEEFARLADQLPNSLLHPTAPSLRPSLFFDSSTNNLNGDNNENDPEARQIQNLNPNINSSKLIFLSRYRDMHSYYLKGEKKLAADTLIGLLTSEIAPKRWWAVCLIDVIPLLEDDEILISVVDTYELLRCLEEIVGPILANSRDSYDNLRYLKRIVQGERNSSNISDGYNENGKTKNINGHEGVSNNIVRGDDGTKAALDQLNVVRYALSRHLARCLVSKH